jgi:lipocalin-like protein
MEFPQRHRTTPRPHSAGSEGSRRTPDPGVDSLVGTWDLKRIDLRNARGEELYPFGPFPVGLLVVTAGGHWSVQIMDPRRPRSSSEDMLGGSPAERAAARQGYVAYAGRYRVLSDRILVHVEVSLSPNDIGRDEVRLFALGADGLQITTPRMQVGGEETVGQLLWSRLP